METDAFQLHNPIRLVTATSLYDGHDVSINIMRRMLQDSGAEVVHLGHNRSADEIVTAAIHEDVQGIAVSSYQGGHLEFFKYIQDLLRERGAGPHQDFRRRRRGHPPRRDRGVARLRHPRIFSPEDGRKLGLQGMINYHPERVRLSDPATP